MSVAYDEAKSIKFYDKKGTLIPEEHIPDLWAIVRFFECVLFKAALKTCKKASRNLEAFLYI